MLLHCAVFLKNCVILSSRGATGPNPVPDHLPGLVMGWATYGLQEPVDAHSLRHLQLPPGEPPHLFVCVKDNDST